MRDAFLQAKKSYDEGGLPIGAVMVENGAIIARGHNRRVQDGDPIAHGEMDCLRHAGRRARYDEMTMYTTLSPCMMCAGTIVQFKIPRVVIADADNFGGNEAFMRDRGVQVDILRDEAMIASFRDWKQTHASIWNGDIGD